MITLTIDKRKVQVPEDTTILDAAERLGIHIPTLCYAKNFKPSTSCMVCVVRVQGLRHFVPACGTRVSENMIVKTEDDHIRRSRKAAIELLLSDHVGDCVGPCVIGCPANMNIPLMLRQIISGDLAAAIRTIKEDIPLPAILGRICSAPCEKVCRRAQHDGAVSICILKRYVADIDLHSEPPYQPECAESLNKQVAIIGAGPAGLSAAYYLKRLGIDPVLYDDHSQPGGILRYSDNYRSVLSLQVIEREIEQILKLGVGFRGNTRIGKNMLIDELKKEYDAILITVGDLKQNDYNGHGDLGVVFKNGKIEVERPYYLTSEKGIFAAGGCVGSRSLCIRAVADGKEAAYAIKSYLLKQAILPIKKYNHQMGRNSEQEMAVFLKQALVQERIEPNDSESGFSTSEAKSESLRCLHCDCRKPNNCQLRDLAGDVGARRSTWQGSKTVFEQITSHGNIIYEPGKCIKCGLCIQITERVSQQVGLSFEGRGFEMKVVVPLNKSLADVLSNVYTECVDMCPTGALAFKD